MTLSPSHPFLTDAPPEWACGYGQDEYGYYADFAVMTGANYWEFVTQRMRWIPAGRFLMGSPESELERRENEGPQHEVILTDNFWLADTACTQALWSAVMTNNPSHFAGPERPVESVAFEDVQKFLLQLSERIPGFNPQLPTEAQWEYACRAGSLGPFSFGDTISPDQANYDGRFPYRGGAKGLFRNETVDVMALPANQWGLYQMHGNVWEWCDDWYGAYDATVEVNPTGSRTGSSRVVRGGSWIFDARYVRSACRYRYDPGYRHGYLGFRLLSSASQETSTPSK